MRVGQGERREAMIGGGLAEIDELADDGLRLCGDGARNAGAGGADR